MTSDEFKWARQTLGLTISELGDVLGLHKRTIRRYEQGKWDIPGSIRLAVLYLLDHPDELASQSEKQ